MSLELRSMSTFPHGQKDIVVFVRSVAVYGQRFAPGVEVAIEKNAEFSSRACGWCTREEYNAKK